MSKELETLTLALVGAGKWGSNYIKTIGQGITGVTLPADKIKTRDYPDLFGHQNEIDGVIIATPTGSHFEIARDLLDHGFGNLLVEKPVTQTLEQALKLQELSERLKALVMVGHIQLYDPAYQELKRHLDKVGKITALGYQGLQSPARADATVLEDWGPHPIYLFEDIMGTKPSSVSARHPKDSPADNVALTLNFGRVRAIAYIGWTSPQRKRILEVRGEKGSLVLDGSSATKTLTLTKDRHQTNLPFPTEPTPLAAQIMEFAWCIRNGEVPKTPLSQGLEVMRVLSLLEK